MFSNPYFQSYYTQDQSLNFSSSTYAHQIYLSKEKPELLKVQFIDYSIEEKVKQSISDNNRDNLLLQCKFERGEYELLFELTNSNNKVYQSKYLIQFSEADVRLLQEGIDKILSNETHNPIELSIKKA